MLACRHLNPSEEKSIFLSRLKVIDIQLTDHPGAHNCVAGVKGGATRAGCADYKDECRQAVAQPNKYVPHDFTDVSDPEKSTFVVCAAWVGNASPS
jgi:hypothetical protein